MVENIQNKRHNFPYTLWLISNSIGQKSCIYS